MTTGKQWVALIGFRLPVALRVASRAATCLATVVAVAMSSTGCGPTAMRTREREEAAARPVPSSEDRPPVVGSVAVESEAAPDPRSLPCESVARIEVRKRERILEAWCREGGMRSFPIGLSRVPVGAKQRQGDDRMPEGDYQIAGHPRPSRFTLFIPIDYPSLADARRGLSDGLISRATHDRIVASHAAARLPPQDTALGGWLGFHGEGPRWRDELDLEWTRGCVAVADATIRWLADHAPRGTPVSIHP